VLDFSQVVVLDYSCADEVVAKLVLRYAAHERPHDVFVLARGLGEQHCDPIEAVLARHRLLLVAELHGAGYTLLGQATPLERRVWAALQLRGHGSVGQVAASAGTTTVDGAAALASLAARRALLRADSDRFIALSSLIDA
jgi:hypothetical protein